MSHPATPLSAPAPTRARAAVRKTRHDIAILEEFREVAFLLAHWVREDLARSGLVTPPPHAPTLDEIIQTLARLALLTEQEDALGDVLAIGLSAPRTEV